MPEESHPLPHNTRTPSLEMVGRRNQATTKHDLPIENQALMEKWHARGAKVVERRYLHLGSHMRIRSLKNEGAGEGRTELIVFSEGPIPSRKKMGDFWNDSSGPNPGVLEMSNWISSTSNSWG